MYIVRCSDPYRILWCKTPRLAPNIAPHVSLGLRVDRSGYHPTRSWLVPGLSASCRPDVLADDLPGCVSRVAADLRRVSMDRTCGRDRARRDDRLRGDRSRRAGAGQPWSGGDGIVPGDLCRCFSVLLLSAATRSAAAATPRIPILVVMIVLPLLAFIVAVGLVQSPLDAVRQRQLPPGLPRAMAAGSPALDCANAVQRSRAGLSARQRRAVLPVADAAVPRRSPARIGQLPFLLLGAASLYAVARRCGARPGHAAYAPFFFVLARPVVEQAVGADVDLVCGGDVSRGDPSRDRGGRHATRRATGCCGA